MKVVLDANIFVSAFAFSGKALEAYRLCIEHHRIISCAEIVADVERILRIKLNMPKSLTSEIVRQIHAATEFIVPLKPYPDICRDKDDNIVLAVARDATANIILTGDKDLLVLEKFESISILTLNRFISLYMT